MQSLQFHSQPHQQRGFLIQEVVVLSTNLRLINIAASFVLSRHLNRTQHPERGGVSIDLWLTISGLHVPFNELRLDLIWLGPMVFHVYVICDQAS